MLVKKIGTPAARPASNSERQDTSTSSRSHASGDVGSVNPRLRSTTTIAGRSPTPSAPPKSLTARPRERRLARLQRRPPQRGGRDGRRQAGLVEAGRQRIRDRWSEVER